MHVSSYKFMEQFVSKYLNPDEELIIADIGSFDVNGSYRPLFKNPKWEYVGIDMVLGPNVDIKVPDPYNYSNIEDDAYDVIISGQTLEHVGRPFRWMEELNRILKLDGLICVICPWFCGVHRTPHYEDYWRVLQPAMELLLKDTGFKILEAFQGSNIEGIGDTVGIAQKKEIEGR